MTVRCLSLALAQIKSGIDKAQNLDVISTAIECAGERGVDLLVFPEAALVSFAGDIAACAEPLDGPFVEMLRAAAQRYNMLIVAGMFTPAEDGRVRNMVIATGRGVEASYQKVHLYDAFGACESNNVEAGHDYVCIDSEWGRIGFATCYDLRFADQFTALGRMGAEIIIVPISWGDGPNKAEQLSMLLRARAHDAQSYLIGCDQAWQSPIGTAPLGVGQSAIIDPAGCVVASLGADADMLFGNIDLDMVADIRARIPIL